MCTNPNPLELPVDWSCSTFVSFILPNSPKTRRKSAAEHSRVRLPTNSFASGCCCCGCCDGAPRSAWTPPGRRSAPCLLVSPPCLETLPLLAAAAQSVSPIQNSSAPGLEAPARRDARNHTKPDKQQRASHPNESAALRPNSFPWSSASCDAPTKGFIRTAGQPASRAQSTASSQQLLPFARRCLCALHASSRV